MIAKGIFEGVQKLESFNILDVPDKVISKVACTVATVEKIGIRIEWLAKVICDICARKSLHSSTEGRAALDSSWSYRGKWARGKILAGVRSEMSLRNLPSG